MEILRKTFDLKICLNWKRKHYISFVVWDLRNIILSSFNIFVAVKTACNEDAPLFFKKKESCSLASWRFISWLSWLLASWLLVSWLQASWLPSLGSSWLLASWLLVSLLQASWLPSLVSSWLPSLVSSLQLASLQLFFWLLVSFLPSLQLFFGYKTINMSSF